MMLALCPQLSRLFKVLDMAGRPPDLGDITGVMGAPIGVMGALIGVMGALIGVMGALIGVMHCCWNSSVSNLCSW